MSAYSRSAYAAAFPYDADIADDRDESDFYSGERICPPGQNTSGNPIRRFYLALFVLAGMGAALQYTNLLASLEPAFAAASRLVEQITARQAEQSPPAATTPSAATSTLPPTAPQSMAAAIPTPTTPPEAAAPPAPAVMLPPVTTVEDKPLAAVPQTKDEPASAPAKTKADTLQKRAEAAGLHPGISHVVLEKLSTADYRNAAIAIEKALAKTPDDGVLVYPAKKKPALAMFEVHFVAGAGANCRRYVVRIAKDGWATTARPMEKCGISAPPAT
jgi:hypothetical protein